MFSRLLAAGAVAGIMLGAAVIPASATPAEAIYYGKGIGTNQSMAEQHALNHANTQAALAGFTSIQCAPYGQPVDSWYYDPTGPNIVWTSSWAVQCFS
jgi:hypothetical protein